MGGWQDAPIVGPARAPAWQSAPVVNAAPPKPVDPDAAYREAISSPMPPPVPGYPAPTLPPKPEGFDARNPNYNWSTPPEPTAAQQFGRGLQLGAQGVGAGIADTVALPVDLPAMAGNAGLSLADMLAEHFGGNLDFRLGQPGGMSGQIRDTAAQGVDSLFGAGTIIPPEQMSPSEKVGYEANRFGANALTTGGLLAEAAPAMNGALPSLTAPYQAAGSTARTLAGDTMAGVGSGAVTGAYHEYVPQYVQDKLGPVGDVIAGITGGIGGAGLLKAGERATATGSHSIAKRRAMPTDIAPLDPVTQVPISRKDFSTAAAMLQDQAYSPATAGDQISAYLAQIGDGPSPTLGPLSADPGLLSAERKARARNPQEFIARDQAVMDSVSQKVGSVRPEGGNPEAPRPLAEQIDLLKTGTANDAVVGVQARKSAAELEQEKLAADVKAGRSLDQSSADLHQSVVGDTFLPDRATKNTLYDSASADPNVVVKTDSARAAAEAVAAQENALNPALRDQPSASIADAFTRPKSAPATGSEIAAPGAIEPPVTRTLAEVLADRQALSRIESESRAQGNFGRADTARGIKGGINADVRAAAESGVPGTEKLGAADAFYRSEFAPAYREGAVSPDFFKSVDRADKANPVLPEKTAGKFLTAGPTSRAAAEDLARIIERTPDPKATTAAATDYVLADAVKSGVIRDGKISETALSAFMANREGMFSQIPEIKARFDDLLTKARNGNAGVSKLTGELDSALKTQGITERDVNTGVLKVITGSEPSKAVASVFAQPDSVKAMREAVSAFKGNPQAAEGWKAAVGDWLREKVSAASKAGVSSDEMASSLPAMRRAFEQNRKALAEVFTPEEMSTLEQAQARLEVLSKRGTQASSGSATAENVGRDVFHKALYAFAGFTGTVRTFTKGAIAGNAAQHRIKLIADQFPDTNAAAKALIDRAWLDPKLAKHLLDFPTTDAQVYAWSKRLNQLLNLNQAGNGND